MTRELRKTFGDKVERPKGVDMALIVDVQQTTIGTMEPEDARAYLENLGKFIEHRRANNLPVTWMTLGHTSKLHEEIPGDKTARDDAQLQQLGFFAQGPNFQARNNELAGFLKGYGPLNGEGFRQKTDMSAFDDENGDAFADYITARSNSVTLVGAVSRYCVGTNDKHIRERGITTAVASNLVVSWDGDDHRDNGDRKLFWGGRAEDTAHHESEIRHVSPNAQFVAGVTASASSLFQKYTP